ncbi:NADH-ubiquinone oxidoreductase-F iron-sulfur binding region domain-containing protein [Thermodesulfobium acidiphilum]|nr:NADH-ubiquinone oxidoreductase-F iron-sulfur binding region domain-containing protein [Thermodesulfobium acidiphilum]
MIAAVGSAGKLFWEKDRCMVDMVQFFLDYTQKNSCGECTPCRIGTKRMQEIVQKVFDGSISDSEISFLKNLATDIETSSRCDLGKMAGKLVRYTLEFCNDDIESRIKGSCACSIPANMGWQQVVMLR